LSLSRPATARKKAEKVDFMPLLDKIGSKLPSWKGKLMTKAARVVAQVVTYHATVFSLPK
jgi:hypothetical protein